MSTNGIIAIIVIVVIIVGGIFLLGRDGTDDMDDVMEDTTEEETAGLDDQLENLLGGEDDDGGVPAESTIDDDNTTPSGTDTNTGGGTTGAGETPSETPPGGASGDSGAGASVPASVQHEVTYSDENGFSPNTLTVAKGDTITWANASGRPMWVASAIHPTHTVYPEKTADDCLGSAFDACEGIPVGESFSFTFNEIGNWKYHDHLRASQTGTVVVE